jgi:hypothetical protein
MFLGWPLTVVGIALCLAIGFVIPRRKIARWSQPIGIREIPEFSIVGGGIWFPKWWPIGATWPLARLEQYSWGVRVGPNVRWAAWYLPTTDLRWDDILTAHRRTSTIRFTSKSALGQWVSFGPRVDDRLIVALKSNGVAVE